ncbi:soil-associated protein, TIGR03435 family [Granulicella pectinivorans]|uniref:Soil-associated protein, TIGR03435 family n=1 Tax=Granulicella pectinivorans TaxID=474950 RepID=A0A1I6LM44_9BACT|nr:TIGR03435 family protein [Granulicella pectinivorans]SFS04469.1 soil-associated protein, TIGR03435 family [Granulicella pectinivorans]
MKRIAAVILWSALALQLAHAQTAGFTPRPDAAQIPSYELVSIHKTPDANSGMSNNDQPDGLTITGMTLRGLIAEAYGFSLGALNKQQLTGAPPWADTQRFDLHAKVDSDDVPKIKELTKAETMMVAVRQIVSRTPTYRMLMLQRLLEDRFQLKIHYEQKVMSLYEMTIAKGGVRMKVAHPADPENGTMSWNPGKLTGQNAPMPFIPVIFAMVLERPVEDKTDTPGNYDFEMHWTPTEGTQQTDAGPSIFTAAEEQLGLKLHPSKGPVWIIVVDHAEMPSEN